MICAKCGGSISDDSKFCYKCGNKIDIAYYNKLNATTTENTCGKCGNKLRDNAKFCDKCGNKIINTYSNKLNIDTNNNYGTNYDELDTYTTDNTNYEYHTQNNNISEVNNVSTQNITQQSYNAPNITPPLKTNNNGPSNKIIIFCGIIIFLIIILAISDENSDTSMSTGEITNNNNEAQFTKTYTNEEEGISFNYPYNWSEYVNSSSTNNIIVSLDTQIQAVDTATMFIGTVKIPYEDFKITELIPDIPESYSNDGYVVQEIIETQIDGIDAIKVVYNLPNSIVSVEYGYVFNGNSYAITFRSLPEYFDTYKPIFDSIMESYKITTPTGNTSQEQNQKDYGLSEQEALEVAQEFVDTHPLYDRIVTGNVEYEPQNYTVSTKGLYLVETMALDGSIRSMWVDKRTGSIFLSSDGVTLEDGEEVYQEIFVFPQYSDTILFKGRKISDYLGNSAFYINYDFGEPTGGTSIDGSLYEGYQYTEYDGIKFLYDNTLSVKSISGNPKLFTYNGITLDKNRDKIVELFGTPSDEYTNDANTSNPGVHWLEYNNDNYELQFGFESEDAECNFIYFFQE